MTNMETNKEMGLGERIMNIKPNVDKSLDANDTIIMSHNNKIKIAELITSMDKARYIKTDDDDLTVGTIDAIDDLVQRAINKLEEASMLFTKAMYKTNK